MEGSQTLRLLCYEKCCGKVKQSKEDGEVTDKIVAKGQIKVQTKHRRCGSQQKFVCLYKKQLQRTITALRYFLLDLPVEDLTSSRVPLVQISMNIWEFRKWFSLYNILHDYTCFF